MDVREIHDEEEKRQIAAGILEALPEWFGIPEAVREYINGCVERPFFCSNRWDEACRFHFHERE